MLSINTVTVVGATGTMGANVAGIFASFGGARVFCVGRDIDRVRETVPRIVRSVRADSIASNLVPADFSSLEECVAESDLIFESVAEDLGVKSEVAERVGRAMRDGAVACTGTSGLSVSRIASRYPEAGRGRFFGVHLFNPPYSMPLCELVSTRWANPETRDGLRDYLQRKLHRTVVEVRDSPAFLANRIGFQFINEAMRRAEECADSGGIDYLDAILGPFTGRSMAPLATSDFVGLDIHKAIVDNVYANTGDYARDTFVLPGFAEGLIRAGRLGRKAGEGLYRMVRHDDGRRRMTVYDIGAGAYRDAIPYAFPFALEMRRSLSEGDYREAFARLLSNHSREAEICVSLLLQYIAYGLYAESEVAYAPGAADDVMAAGFNWCPPLAMAQALGLACDVRALMEERVPQVCERVDVERILAGTIKSSYDFRPYFRAGR